MYNMIEKNINKIYISAYTFARNAAVINRAVLAVVNTSAYRQDMIETLRH